MITITLKVAGVIPFVQVDVTSTFQGLHRSNVHGIFVLCSKSEYTWPQLLSHPIVTSSSCHFGRSKTSNHVHVLTPVVLIFIHTVTILFALHTHLHLQLALCSAIFPTGLIYVSPELLL